MRVSGADRLVFYKNMLGKTIMLLSDPNHEEGCRKNPKKSMTTFINSIIEKTPDGEILDIFLGGSFGPISSYAASHSIGLFRTSYDLQRLSQQTNPDNLLLHYSDPSTVDIPHVNIFKLRASDISDATSEDFLLAIKYLMTVDKESNEQYFKKIFRPFGIKNFTQIKAWAENYFTIIEKQLENIDRDIMTKEVIIDTLLEVYNQRIEIHKSHDSNNNEELRILMSVQMDMYVLSKMFELSPYAQPFGNLRRRMDKIIIYAEKHQVEIYGLFFDILIDHKHYDDSQDVTFPQYGEESCVNVSSKFDFWKDKKGAGLWDVYYKESDWPQ